MQKQSPGGVSKYFTKSSAKHLRYKVFLSVTLQPCSQQLLKKNSIIGVFLLILRNLSKQLILRASFRRHFFQIHNAVQMYFFLLRLSFKTRSSLRVVWTGNALILLCKIFLSKECFFTFWGTYLLDSLVLAKCIAHIFEFIFLCILLHVITIFVHAEVVNHLQNYAFRISQSSDGPF